MSELKPCPFCGSEAEIERYGDRHQSTQYACIECGCFLETCEESDHGTRWNRRPVEDALVEALKIHHEWSIAHLPGYDDHGDEAVAFRATRAALKLAEGGKG